MHAIFQFQNRPGVCCRWIFLSLFCSAIVVFSGCRTQPEENFLIPHPTLTLEQFEAYARSGKVPVLDARELPEYKAGHVPGAVLLPPGANFYHDYERLEKILAPCKKHLVIVYCDDQWCGRSDELQMQLIAQGFQHVARFSGGWQEWQKAGLPVETGLAKK